MQTITVRQAERWVVKYNLVKKRLACALVSGDKGMILRAEKRWVAMLKGWEKVVKGDCEIVNVTGEVND